MGNDFFRFKEFKVFQQRTAMKVCTDACLFGAWVADKVKGRNLSVLDIGSGTGLLSLMIAGNISGTIEAIEIEAGAYLDAKQNFEESPWNTKLFAHHISLQEYRPSRRFGLIVSNPPFFENDLRSPDENRNTALHSGDLSFDELFRFAAEHLQSEGAFAILIGARREKELERCAAKNGFYCRAKVKVSQTPRHEAFRIMYYYMKAEGERVNVEQMVIRSEENDYSEQFKNLLKRYYLYL